MPRVSEPAIVVQPVPKPPVVRARPSPKPDAGIAAAPAREDGVMAGAIAASLDEGMQCMSQKKFDCAVANANAVLRLAPGNRQAQDMKRRAREAQERAMSQIKIE